MTNDTLAKAVMLHNELEYNVKQINLARAIERLAISTEIHADRFGGEGPELKMDIPSDALHDVIQAVLKPLLAKQAALESELAAL